MDTSREQITHLLGEMSAGKQDAADQLAPLVYKELHRIAQRYMGRERGDHTLQATILVNEAFMKLAGQETTWQNRSHFYAVASQVMRRILVDYARAHAAQKRGGAMNRVDLEEVPILAESHPEKMLALDEALSRLSQWDPVQSRIVEMRFFGGLTDKEIGEVLGVSMRTVKREWSLAKAWLYSEIGR